MATPVASPVRKRSALRLFIKVLSFLFCLLLAGIVIIGLWFQHAAKSALAQLDGTARLPGLQAPVHVIRDQHGVPHLSAASLADLFFAQGYVTAQDRLWQMDLTRRAMAGEMAEVLPGNAPSNTPATRVNGGPPPTRTWTDYDKQQRILRLRAVADRVSAQLPERDRAFFDAYAAGVNAYMAQQKDHLPIEFRVLGYAPRPWTVSDSVLIGIGMSQLLNPQYEIEYHREKIAQLVSPELMADLYPTGSSRDHAPADDAGQTTGDKTSRKDARLAPRITDPRITKQHRPHASARSAADAFNLVGLAPALSALNLLHSRAPENNGCEACLPGSNNWVVSGAHTVTGKPLLSNDMHLPHRQPGVWYEAHLHAGDFNIEGFTLPGVPFVIVGHNQRIAWGFTNLNPDVQDLFIENFNAQGEYQTPTGWQQPEKQHEVIHVKGKPDAEFDVVLTRHGPIISSLLPGETRQIALQWLIYDTRHISIPLFDLDSAQNWEQFRKALSAFSTPSQNVVYGDVDGNIGYQPMGFIPTRASGDGTVPVPGADGKHDWTGLVPFDKLPAVYNPPGGIIATANSKITPKDYPYQLATQWFPPYRTERIYHVLQQNKKFSPPDMLALQTDITSEYDRFFADHFVYAIDHSSKAGARTRQAAEVMRGFDGRMLADSAAPTIEVKTRAALWKLLLQPKLGENWQLYDWPEQSLVLENLVQSQPDRWLPPGFTNFNDLLNAAVEKALEAAPADLHSWKYGEQYPVVINHPLFGAMPGMANLSAPGRHPQSGGGYTVKQVGRGFGPSERMTVDFSNLDASTFNLVQGESGQLFSPYYLDHWPAWFGGTTFTLAYSDAAIRQTKAHELTLEPAK